MEKIKVQCCVCGQNKTSDSKWDGIEKPVDRISDGISHGYCPGCFKSEMDRLDKFFQTKKVS